MSHPDDILGRMCIMCDGASRDEVLFDVHGAIERHGYHAIAVEADPPNPGWAYTIGLANRGHAEFVLVDPPPDAAQIFRCLADSVLDGSDVYDHGHTARLGPYDARLVRVADTHIDRGLVALWMDYYAALGNPIELDVLQVVLEECRCGDEHPLTSLRLDDPRAPMRIHDR